MLNHYNSKAFLQSQGECYMRDVWYPSYKFDLARHKEKIHLASRIAKWSFYKFTNMIVIDLLVKAIPWV